MLTRFVRTQLILFTIASLVGVAVMLFGYMQLPTLLGLGRTVVKLELPATGGLYKFSNVTYRGVQVGKVTGVDLTPTGAVATLSLDSSPKIPAALTAHVRSMSAVGEQYVDLQPSTDEGPYLASGSVIPREATTIPQAVGPMLDQVSALVDTIPKEQLSKLLDETYKAFNGTGYDFGSMLDSASTISREGDRIADRTRALVDDSVPLLNAQAQTTDSIRTWGRSLAGITGQISTRDAEVRNVLREGPAFAAEASALLNQLKPTLPILLTNLTTIGQIGVTYHASLEQLLVLLPPYVAQIQTYAPTNNPAGLPNGDFSLGLADPVPCTVGFLPPSAWRSPADTTTIDTPDNLYCKLPHDSPIAVRGARNYPCQGFPGKRAPTVELCEDPRGYQPLAQRQHALGPYPFDPNLVSQGVPIDSRALPDSNTFGPVDGTPLPEGMAAPPPGSPPAPPAGPPRFPGMGPGAMLPGQPLYTAPPVAPPPGATAQNPLTAPLPPVEAPGGVHMPDVPNLGPLPDIPQMGTGVPPGPVGSPEVAPSAYSNGAAATQPSMQVTKYNPRTGEYTGSDGAQYQQADLVTQPKSWQDLLPS
ncbi:MCE family protein [Mycolicibacterium fallax]|uniref:Mammalian cell entry protein n=1 Tax=Mycolicibacterium fallax TaxID=1793 RepID=A0A1X1RI01_MYCFA|nr:MlaD family protein [Mycolicibacterium fallax]ORV06712.1 mammalian cell entry protein [Mycolicibacterium fallax]BBY96663.1 mammalian cell entry protein [Mycolicibacterium fallax]HSA39347.1 MlaD family protein [Mycobacterium sp.]